MTLDHARVVDTVIRSRRSIYPKQFKKGEQLPDSAIDHLLDTARYAPTHRLTQPWRYQVYGRDAVKDFFTILEKVYRARTPDEDISDMKIKKYRDKAEQTSHVIVLIMQRDAEERVPEIEEVCACAAAAQNMYASMMPLGIAGYWSTGLAFTTELAEALNLSEGQQCLGYFLLGVPDENAYEAPRFRKPLSQISEFKY